MSKFNIDSASLTAALQNTDRIPFARGSVPKTAQLDALAAWISQYGYPSPSLLTGIDARINFAAGNCFTDSGGTVAPSPADRLIYVKNIAGTNTTPFRKPNLTDWPINGGSNAPKYNVTNGVPNAQFSGGNAITRMVTPQATLGAFSAHFLLSAVGGGEGPRNIYGSLNNSDSAGLAAISASYDTNPLGFAGFYNQAGGLYTCDRAYHYIAITSDGTTASIYWDGVLFYSTTQNQGVASHNSQGFGMAEYHGDYFNGNIVEAAYCYANSTPLEIALNQLYYKTTYPTVYCTGSPFVVWVGDSNGCTRYSGSPGTMDQSCRAIPTGTLDNWFNHSISGQGTQEYINTYYAQFVRPWARNQGPGQPIFVLDGLATNNFLNQAVTAAQAYAASCTFRQMILNDFPNAKVILIDCLSHTGGSFPAFKNAYQALAIANSGGFDGVVDVTANANIGADSAYSSATYFADQQAHLNGTGSTVKAGLVTPVLLSVITGITTSPIIYAGHISTWGAIPTLAAGTGAGTSPTVSLAAGSTDTNGTVTVTTGTLPTGGAVVVTVTLNVPFLVQPKTITLSPANAAAAVLSGVTMVFATTASINTWIITAGATGLTAATTYKWQYDLKG